MAAILENSSYSAKILATIMILEKQGISFFFFLIMFNIKPL